MPRRRKVGGAANALKVLAHLANLKGGAPKRRRSHRVRGAGWLGDVWSGIKSVAGKVAGPVNDLLKSTKVISKFAPSLLPGVGSAIGSVAGLAGYGRKKRVVRKHGGYKITGIRGPPIEVMGYGRKRRKRGGAAHSMRKVGGYKTLLL
jgi:hypothetical protein